jgi:hypothetical protein
MLFRFHHFTGICLAQRRCLFKILNIFHIRGHDLIICPYENELLVC